MLSIVVPVFNEEESIRNFYKELYKVISKISKKHEIIFIDDGSTDRSLNFLREIEKNDKNIKIYSFRKNQGKSEALSLGFQKAKGNYIVTLDADLQDKPEEIEKLIKKSEEGYELVCGWRKNRNDPLPKIFSSKLFNFLAGILWGLHLHDYNCGLKLYSSEAAKSIRLYGGMHRFIPLLVYQKNFLITEVEVSHNKRLYGKSKYGFSKLWKDLPDIFTMLFLTKYSQRPLHFFGMVGGTLFFIGTIILSYLTIIHFQGEAIGRRPLLFLGMMLVLSGFQIVFTGLLADMINVLNKKNEENQLKYSSSN